MSEKFQSNIERYDKKLTAKIGRTALVFSYLNTRLFEHAPEYEQFDHAYRTNDDGASGKYFMKSESPELYKALSDNHYPKTVMPYPTEHDERVVMQHYDTELHNGLNKLLESTDE